MPVNAATNQKISTYLSTHPNQAADLRSNLSRAADGDQHAIDAVKLAVGIDSAAEVRAAAAAYVQGQLDNLFAIGGSADHQRTIGNVNTPGAQPVTGGMNQLNFLSSANQATSFGTPQQLAQLGTRLRELDAERGQALLDAREAGSKANQSEAFFKSNKASNWSDTFNGDKKKVSKEAEAAMKRDKAAAEAANNRVESLTGEITGGLRSHLRGVGHTEYTQQLEKMESATRMQGTTNIVASGLERAADRLDRAARSENFEILMGGSDPFFPGLDGPRGSNAVDSATLAVQQLNAEIDQYNFRNPDARLQRLPEMPNISIGEDGDNFTDVIGGLVADLDRDENGDTGIIGLIAEVAGAISSAHVAAKCREAAEHIRSRKGAAQSLSSQLDGRISQSSSKVSDIEEALRQQALAASDN